MLCNLITRCRECKSDLTRQQDFPSQTFLCSCNYLQLSQKSCIIWFVIKFFIGLMEQIWWTCSLAVINTSVEYSAWFSPPLWALCVQRPWSFPQKVTDLSSKRVSILSSLGSLAFILKIQPDEHIRLKKRRKKTTHQHSGNTFQWIPQKDGKLQKLRALLLLPAWWLSGNAAQSRPQPTVWFQLVWSPTHSSIFYQCSF